MKIAIRSMVLFVPSVLRSKMRIQAPLPAGDNEITCQKPKFELGCLHNTAEIILEGECHSKRLYSTVFSRHCWRMKLAEKYLAPIAMWLYEKWRPMRFHKYRMSVCLNPDETRRLIQQLQEKLVKLNRK